MKKWGRRKSAVAAMLSFFMIPLLSATLHASEAGGDKIFYAGKNYVFSGNWSQKEINTMVALQDKAKNILEQCLGYITPREQQAILDAYNRPMILHIKNNRLGRNIGASVARRSIEDAEPLALELYSFDSYSAMQINVRELFPRGEKEILKTLLHEMAHNASPEYTHPRMSEIWDLNTRKIKPGRMRSEYYGSVPLRVENCVRADNFGGSKY